MPLPTPRAPPYATGACNNNAPGTPQMETLFRGNVTEVKVVLASVALALASYQLVLAAVGYRKLRPRFLEPRPAFRAHRASGDTIAFLLVLVAVLFVSYFELEDDAALHAVTGAALIVALTIVAVTAKLGPTSAAELESREDRAKERQEQLEERQERREDSRGEGR